MQTRKILLAALVAAATTGCASVAMTPKAARVQIQSHNSTLLASCAKIGPVSAVSSAQLEPYFADMDARIKLREAAADVGADTVAVVSSDAMPPRIAMQGVALRCY